MEVKVETYLYEMGCKFIEYDVIIQKTKVDRIGYTIKNGSLDPVIFVKTKNNLKKYSEEYMKISKVASQYSCDALLITNNEEVHFIECKSPRTPGIQIQSCSQIKEDLINKEDIKKIFINSRRSYLSKLTDEEFLKFIQAIIIVRYSLFSEWQNANERWLALDREGFKSIYKVMCNRFGMEFEPSVMEKLSDFSFQKGINDFSLVPFKGETIASVYYEFAKQANSRQYQTPKYVHELIKNVIKTFRREKENFLFYGNGTSYFSYIVEDRNEGDSFVKTYQLEKKQNTLLLIQLLCEDSYLKFHDENIYQREEYKIERLVSVPFSFLVFELIDFFYHKHVNIKELFENLSDFTEGNAYFLFIVPEFTLNAKGELTKAINDSKNFKVISIVSLPEHTFRPYLSIKSSILFIQKTSMKEDYNLFTYQIHSLEKDVQVYIEQLKNWRKGRFEQHVDHILPSTMLKENQLNLNNLLLAAKEQKTYRRRDLSEFVQFNSEKAKLCENQVYKYVEIKSISNMGILQDAKTVKGDKLSKRTKYMIREGDLCLSLIRPGEKGSYGYIGLATKEFDGCVASENICVLRSKKKISAYVLYFLLRNSEVAESLNLLSNGNIPKLTIEKLKKFNLPIETFPQKYEKKGKELFLQWVETNSLPFSKIINEIVTFELKRSDVMVEILGNVAEIKLGFTKKSNSKLAEKDNVIIVRSKNLSIDDLYLNGMELFDDQVDYEQELLSIDDVLIDKTNGTIGRCSIVDSDNLITNQHIYIVRLKNKKKILPLFLVAYLKTEHAQKQIGEQKMLTKSTIRSLTINVPPIEVQKRIIERIHLERQKRVKINEEVFKFSNLILK